MRTKVLGIAAAAVAASSLTLGLHAAPAGAAAGIDGGNISLVGALPTEVDVTATAPGNAVAVWVKPVVGGERIYASHAVRGSWGLPINVIHSVATAVENLHVVGNEKGDVAAVWTQTINGEERVRSARYVGGGQWDGPATLSASDTTGINDTAAAMDASGRVHVVIEAEVDSADPVRSALWAKEAAPVLGEVSGRGTDPSLDVAPDGTALVGFHDSNFGSPEVEVSRRTPGTDWTDPDPVLWPDDARAPQVGIADNGTGTIVFRGTEGGIDRVVSAKVTAAGLAGGPDIVSAPGIDTSRPSLDVTAAGTAIASWSQFDGSNYSVLAATRPATSDFGNPVVYEADAGTSPFTIPFTSDGSRRVVVHDGSNQLTFRYRTSAIQPLTTYAGGISEGEIAADADGQGNVVAVSIVDNGGASYVQADYLDVSGPVSAPSTAIKAQTLSTSFPVGWTATDALSQVESTDVIVSTSAWNQAGFTDPAVVGNNLANGPFDFTGALGRTYCFETQSIDSADNLGSRSAQRCTTVPLDDKQLAGSGWTRAAKAGHFQGTLASTTTKGRQLVRSGVKARRLALVATTVANGGTVQVLWNNKVIKTISLKGKTTKKKLIPIATFQGVRSGTVKIRVTSPTGRPVHIDGLVVAK
ncbi:hypothetical protein ACFQ0K_12105 [Nocardioides caeni]|uniref:Fibronectin type III domain-containing protein n=1 Tax=Nocardioides caeni TaxID=574700 RepID=A0A4S8NLR9_9ACTN|nr:hypothetical protein [Nocardioides caeni]THV17818.1 hypothetical protein E9934_04965 [Nocardioides caeni]